MPLSSPGGEFSLEGIEHLIRYINVHEFLEEITYLIFFDKAASVLQTKIILLQ